MINEYSEIPYDDIDFQIRDLVKYLNKFDGIQTTSSCFGHNEAPCRIWFDAESIESLNNLIFKVFDYDNLWEISIYNSDFPRNYPYLRMLLHSKNIKEYPTVDLMVCNLTYRLKEILKDVDDEERNI